MGLQDNYPILHESYLVQTVQTDLAECFLGLSVVRHLTFQVMRVSRFAHPWAELGSQGGLMYESQ
jgi:hypothetical protein